MQQLSTLGECGGNGGEGVALVGEPLDLLTELALVAGFALALHPGGQGLVERSPGAPPSRTPGPSPARTG
jgi:hypothetical protein